MRRFALLLSMVLAVMVGSVLAQSLASQIDFMDSIPGLTVVNKTDNARVYKLTGSPNPVFDEIKKQLRGRGWNIGADSNLGMVRSLTATKGNLSFHVALAANQISVSVAAQGVGNTTTTTASGGTVINENSVARTIACNHANVTVNGTGDRLTLTGNIDALIINGNLNAVEVQAQVGHLTVNGKNNTVRWSKSHNPTAPGISNNGDNNQVVEGN